MSIARYHTAIAAPSSAGREMLPALGAKEKQTAVRATPGRDVLGERVRGARLPAAQPGAHALDELRIPAEAGEVDGAFHRDVEQRADDGGLPDRLAAVLAGLPALVLEPVDVLLLEEHGRLAGGPAAGGRRAPCPRERWRV